MFGTRTANECIVQRSFKKACKGEDRLQDEDHDDWISEVDNNQPRAITEADPHIITQEVAKEVSVNHSMVISAFKAS